MKRSGIITAAVASLALAAAGAGCDSESNVDSPDFPQDAGAPDGGHVSDAGGNWWETDDDGGTDGGNWWETGDDAGDDDAGTVVVADAGDADQDAGTVGQDAGPEDSDAGTVAEWSDDERPLNDESALTGVRANYDPRLVTPTGSTGGTPAQFLAFPFPADHRRNEDGTVRFDDFPRPSSLAQTLADKLLDRYLAPTGGVDGFSLNGAVHVSFDGALDVSGVPTEGDAFLEEDAVFKILDVDPSSPEFGTVRPLRWEWQAKQGNYVAANSLAVAPAWGFPLREANTYALVVMKEGLRGADGNPVRQPLLLSALLANRSAKPSALSSVDDALYQKMRASYAPLREALFRLGIGIDEVAVATVFTTQDATKDLRRLYAHLESEMKAGTWNPVATYQRTDISYWGSLCNRPGSSDTWTTCTWKWNSTDTAKLYQLAASFTSHNYQQGQVPYLYEGGNFKFKYNGTPYYADEDLTLVVTVPEHPMVTASGCVPIVEIAHGTGGDAYSGLGDDTALRLAARGIATVGMDQPLHGDRFDVTTYLENIDTKGVLGIILSLGSVDAIDEDTFLSLVNFNFLNLDAARSCIRQSAVDTRALTLLIKNGGLDVPAAWSPTGKKIEFCKDKVGFFGHSQGALSGAVAAGMTDEVGGWLLSAGGGGLGVTILDRKDFGDFPTLLGGLFNLNSANGEKLTEQHVLMTVIQTMVDVTDPINYAPYWMHYDKLGEPTSQLCTSGLLDSETPARSARAQAVAAHLTPMKPAVTDLEEFIWAGLSPAFSPMSGNNPGTTNAFIQWANDGANTVGANDEQWAGHFLVFHRPEAINASMRFLETYFAPESSDGTPTIERDASADVR